MTTEAPETLPALLARAARDPGRGVILADGRGRPGPRRSWGELEAAALRCAARLVARGLGPGRPVLVCLPTSWAFLEHWFGVLLAGAHPVAIAPPGTMGTSETQLRRIDAVAAHLDAALLLCRAAVADQAQELDLALSASRAVRIEELAEAAPRPGFAPPKADPADVAFLQLTSGSTGRSRAAVIPHRALVHNLRAIDEALGAPAGHPASRDLESCVSWLPLHHDMGLVGCCLSALHGRLDLVLLQPKTFLGRPHAWLERLGSSGPTGTAAPNFAYQTCVERVPPERLAGADLSLWRGAMVGAEMIRPDTMATFAETFAPAGFDARALRPCYGMAEATLALTFDRAGQGVRTHRLSPERARESGLVEVACVGSPVADSHVRVVAPDGSARPEGAIGEVLGRGPGVFAGYWRDPEATAEALRDGWLATGDLGFVRGGELYVTGRTKDLIIVHGANVMPHEIEWAAEAASGGGGTCRAGAFAVARGPEGELPVVALEVGPGCDGGLAELEHEVRRRVGRALPVPLADVVFVRRGGLPKTTSGKVQRGELKRRYQSGELERLAIPET